MALAYPFNCEPAKGQQPRCGPKTLDSPAVEWVNMVLESAPSFFAVLISIDGADQESG